MINYSIVKRSVNANLIEQPGKEGGQDTSASRPRTISLTS